jgi:hypothetical protein
MIKVDCGNWSIEDTIDTAKYLLNELADLDVEDIIREWRESHGYLDE